MLNNKFDLVEYVVKNNFLYLKNIHGCYIFTKKVCEEMPQK